MTVYLYPEMSSKKAYKTALKSGKEIIAIELSPFGERKIEDGIVYFSGPHYPKPHKYYGRATITNGNVVSIS